jgi:hypothetical protein
MTSATSGSIYIRKICLITSLILVLGAVSAAWAAGVLSRYESGDRVFEETEIGDKLVYYHQRMLDGAIVEKDYIVYQFDKTTLELLARNSHWRDDLPEHLPERLVAQHEAEALVSGEVIRSALYVISPESDVFPLDPVPENPCWVVRHIVDGRLVITLVDAVEARLLGNGIPPPTTGFSLTGPWYFGPCSGAWTAWMQNAATWFETMGYPTEEVSWPGEDKVKSRVQSCETAVFYELAHGSHNVFENGCIGGQSPEITYASEIETWIADYAKMPFAFIGSCGGMCWKIDGSFAYEFRKGSQESTTVVGYCDMAEPQCDICWGQSIDWQNALFNYMNQGWTVRAAVDQAKADYPQCGDNRCMRFSGDTEFAVVPVVKRDPWAPLVTVIQPNGSEVVEFGVPYEIRWAAVDNAVIESVAILLSTDSGTTFPDTIATGEANDSSFMWTVPDIDSKTARIRVAATDCASNQGTDISDGDFTLWGLISGIDVPDIAGNPAEVVLELEGGNPVHPDSRIVFGIPEAASVKLGIYDVAGRLVANVASGRLPAGYHAVHWGRETSAGLRLGPGIYFVRLDCERGSDTIKAVVAD